MSVIMLTFKYSILYINYNEKVIMKIKMSLFKERRSISQNTKLTESIYSVKLRVLTFKYSIRNRTSTHEKTKKKIKNKKK